MKRIRWVVAGVLALAFLAWLAWPQASEFLPGSRSSNRNSGAASSDRRGSPRADLPAEKPRLDGDYFTLDAVTNVAQLEGPEAKRLLSEGDRLEMLWMAQLLCNVAELDRKYGRAQAMPPSRRRSTEFRMAFARSFCDPTLPHYTAYIERLAELDVRDDTAVAMGLHALEDDEKESVGVPTAARLVRESPSVSAMKRASDFLILSGRNLPQVERVPFPRGMDDPQSRLDAQRMAVDRVACAMRGGCGPRGLQTMAWCGPCGPSVTLDQVWQQKYSPEVVAYSRLLAAAISADRRRAGGH